jgi:hypothetical protein
VSNFIQTCAKDALVRSQSVLLAAGDGDLRGVLERRRVGADWEFVEVENGRGAHLLTRLLGTWQETRSAALFIDDDAPCAAAFMSRWGRT